MKRFGLSALFVLGAMILGAAEIPPFYPELGPEIPFGSTTVSQSEVAVGGVKPGSFTAVRSLDGDDWKILPPVRAAKPFADNVDLDKGYQSPGFDDSKWEAIAVPLDWYRKYPDAYRRNEPYVKGFYRKTFELSEKEIAGKRVLLRFGVIGYDGLVFVNGKEVGRHQGDFTPCEFDVTDAVKPGKNVLAIRVLTDFGTTHGTVPAAKHIYGSQWGWANIKGGLWQSVELAIVPPVYIESMLISPELANNSIRVDYTIDNRSGKAFEGTLKLNAVTALKADPNRPAGNAELAVSLKPGVNTGNAVVKLDHPVRWSPENPFLYYLAATLEDGGKAVSGAVERFGFREFKIVDGKFHLNGERIYLFGENIRSVDFGGRGTTPEEDRKRLFDYLAGFKRQGVNIIRNAHLPILPVALELADELGLMVYDEWGWSFTNLLDEPAFQASNDRELAEFVKRDYNHPAVVMWSGANEVRHRDKPDVKRQLDRQIDNFRKFDRSGRPAGAFSGSASWSSYGAEPLNTDFLDLHSYYGLSSGSWTQWNKVIDRMYDESLKHYKVSGDVMSWPYIIWECVGFTWGGKLDKRFKVNDMARYAKYARTPTTWAEGNGIGYAGTIGLAAALDPARGMDYGKALFGHRLLELARQNPRVDGFAPWQHATGFRPATVWNQPVLAGIRNAQGLPPSNFFAGREEKRELFVVNSTNRGIENASAKVWLVAADGREIPLAECSGISVAPWKTTVIPLQFRLPAEALNRAQLRVRLCDAQGKERSRNFYSVYVGDEGVLTKPLKSAEKLALIDFGRVDELKRILDALHVPYTVVPAEKLDSAFTAAIIPPGVKDKTYRFDTKRLDAWMQQGGKLLVLEQPSGVGGILAGVQTVNSPLAFADLVFPAHPVFAGLDQRNFDLWENPEEGRVISAALFPFSTNAIAVRGPLLGSQNVENAITEALIGKGRIFWSQLDATGLWGVDSSASTYLWNVLDYMLSGGKPFAKATELARDDRTTFSIPAGRERFIDLRKQANRGFRDDGNDTGWTGQGTNDFRNMPVGKQTVNGVEFEIIDPAKNGGKGCLAVRGSDKPNFPARIEGIPVNAKVARFFFLHTSAWKGAEAGCYRIHYDDGATEDYMLIQGRNIGDWWNTARLPEALPGIVRANPLTESVGTYMAVWENPYPDKTVVSMDFLAAGQSRNIDYLPGRAPVPVLVAVTAELAGENPLPVSPAWKGSGRNGVPAPKVAVDGGTAKIAFPKVDSPEKDFFCFAMTKFDAAKFDPAKHRYLVMTVRSDSPGGLDVVVPERNWSGSLRFSVELDDRFKEFRKLRLDLGTQPKNLLKGDKTLRGELFLMNGENKRFYFPRPAVTVEVRDVRFE